MEICCSLSLSRHYFLNYSTELAELVLSLTIFFFSFLFIAQYLAVTRVALYGVKFLSALEK